MAARDIRGDTALHVAAAHGHLNCVELLIGVKMFFFLYLQGKERK